MVWNHDLNAFPLVLTDPKRSAGIEGLAQAFEIAPIRASMILLNRPQQVESAVPGLDTLKLGEYRINDHTWVPGGSDGKSESPP